MAAGPKRRTVRLAHLNAAAVPIEQALLARAEVLEQQIRDQKVKDPAPLQVLIAGQLAGEFRDLAEELHWRG